MQSGWNRVPPDATASAAPARAPTLVAARSATPSAERSGAAERTTARWLVSACSCISQSLVLGPPSAAIVSTSRARGGDDRFDDVLDLLSDRFECGAGKVGACRGEVEVGDQPARLRIPPRRAETRESGNDRHVRRRGDGRRELVKVVRSAVEQLGHPPDGCTGGEDVAFEGVRRRADLPGNRFGEACVGRATDAVGQGHDRTAGPVRGLDPTRRADAVGIGGGVRVGQHGGHWHAGERAGRDRDRGVGRTRFRAVRRSARRTPRRAGPTNARTRGRAVGCGWRCRPRPDGVRSGPRESRRRRCRRRSRRCGCGDGRDRRRRATTRT